MMIGIGTPISQSRIPRPMIISSSYLTTQLQTLGIHSGSSITKSLRVRRCFHLSLFRKCNECVADLIEQAGQEEV
jgi:hypothetical protein